MFTCLLVTVAGSKKVDVTLFAKLILIELASIAMVYFEVEIEFHTQEYMQLYR